MPDGAAVSSDDRGDDGQAEAGATWSAGPAGAGGVGAVEPLEDPGGGLWRDAGSVVLHLDHGGCRSLPDQHLDGGVIRGVGHGVGDQVGQHLAQREVVPRHHDRAVGVAVATQRDDAPGCTHPGVLDHVVGHDHEVDVVVRAVRCRVQTGEQQQVLDKARHAGGLVLDPAHGACDVLRLGDAADAVELGIALDGGQRGAQLVGGVGHELAHPGLGGLAHREGLLDLGEHGVEGLRERGHLVVRVALRDAPGQVPGRDRRGRVLDAGQRSEGAADGEPADQGDSQQGRQTHHGGEDQESVERVGDRPERHRHRDGAPLTGHVLVAREEDPPLGRPVRGAHGERLGAHPGVVDGAPCDVRLLATFRSAHRLLYVDLALQRTADQ